MKSYYRVMDTRGVSREEWLAERRNGIGGSDAATVVGLNPWSSRYALYLDKTGQLKEQPDNERMRLGRDLEEYVAQRFCGETVKRVRRVHAMFAMTEYPFIRADVDREVVGENAGLECKTATRLKKADLDAGVIPLQYYCQCYHYMNVRGYDRMYLAILLLGEGLYIFTIERNEKEQDALLTAEIAFWRDYVEAGVFPPADGSDSTAEAISEAFGGMQDNGDTVSLSQFDADLSRLEAIRGQMKELEAQKQEIENRIKAEIGEATGGESENWIVSWKASTRSSVDTDALKKAGIYDNYKKTTITRTFKIKYKGENEQ